ncbi:MAG: hypothetical protein E7161_00315 [Firmicutes bacterium]|nr:hypothetical protein [Bacillota bacterium]
MKRYIILIVFIFMMLMPTYTEAKEYQELVCMYVVASDTTGEHAILIEQLSDGSKTVYTRKPNTYKDDSDKTYNFIRDKWDTIGEIMGGNNSKYDIKDWENGWVETPNINWYSEIQPLGTYDYRNGDFCDASSGTDYLCEGYIKKITASEFDLADYCGDDDMNLYRFHDTASEEVGSPYWDYTTSAFYATLTKRHLVFSEDILSLETNEGFIEYVFAASSFTIGKHDGSGNLDPGYQGAIDNIDTIIPYDGDYEEYKNIKYNTYWNMYCHYGSPLNMKTVVELYVNNSTLLLYNPNSETNYPYSAFNHDDVKNMESCPPVLYGVGAIVDGIQHYTYYLKEPALWSGYSLLYSGSGFVPGEENVLIQEQSCESLLGNPQTNGTPAYYLQFVLNLIKYAAIILLVVLSIFDFVGAVSSHDQEILSKCVKKVGFRLIWCVAIFFIPTILNYIFTFVEIYSPSTCGIK